MSNLFIQYAKIQKNKLPQERKSAINTLKFLIFIILKWQLVNNFPYFVHKYSSGKF